MPSHCETSEDVDKPQILLPESPSYRQFLETNFPSRIVTSSERHLIRLRTWLGRRLFRSLGSNGICRFGPQTLVKFTPFARFSEAANMEFVSHHTSIPVPHVHDVFIVEDRTYIIMDYVDAPELTYVWSKLTKVQQEGIFAQLKDFLNQLRSLKPLYPGRIHTADGSAVFDSRLCLDNRPIGPFSTVTKFHTHLGHNSLHQLEKFRQYWPLIDFMAQKQYRTVFSHSDIAPRNVLARDSTILAVIDWECAGWYPEYWEYTRWGVSNFRSPQSWHDARDKILDMYKNELQVEDLLDSTFTRL